MWKKYILSDCFWPFLTKIWLFTELIFCNTDMSTLLLLCWQGKRKGRRSFVNGFLKRWLILAGWSCFFRKSCPMNLYIYFFTFCIIFFLFCYLGLYCPSQLLVFNFTTFQLFNNSEKISCFLKTDFKWFLVNCLWNLPSLS